MNAVEIEEAVSALAAEPFDRAEFAFRFIEAFGAKDTTVKRLRKGETNASDVPGGLLWRNYIHLAVAETGEVGATLAALRASAKTASHKARFILATDGVSLEAEELVSGDPLACSYASLGEHFAAFLPLAGISTVKEIKNNPIDVKATGRLNRLYVELLKDNPDWATEARRRELNHFLARLIFCFFAEDTGIFREGSFTATINQMSHAGHGSGEERWGNTHEVLEHLFLAMDTDTTHKGEPDDRYRRAAGIRPWADVFPYVNGGLFTGATECPRFSRTARAYLLRAGELDWKEINPDIFGSMIQAVAEDEERGELGMHYTSVPNILKVLNPLFLDDLRQQLEAAEDSKPKLRNLRKRLANIRVFDPACGSGNFLLIAYKEMRAIEAEIVDRLGGDAALKLSERRSVIALPSFYGIEIKDFAAEIARLALLIAQYQGDCLYLTQTEARAMVLPLHRTGQIHTGNALRTDWLEVCPPAAAAGPAEYDLAGPTGRFLLDESGASGSRRVETYICGNPPYGGSKWQTPDQKEDLRIAAGDSIKDWKSLDYVGGWFVKACAYSVATDASFAFVSTNSVCQGQQVPVLWPYLLGRNEISFAHTSFKWQNLASNNAGVTVIVVGLRRPSPARALLFSDEADVTNVREVERLNPYLVPGTNVIVEPSSKPISPLPPMLFGNMPRDGGHLILSEEERRKWPWNEPEIRQFVRPFRGSEDFINGLQRSCIWIDDEQKEEAGEIHAIAERLERVSEMRRNSQAPSTRSFASRPHRFVQIQGTARRWSIIVPRVSSETRPFLPVGLLSPQDVVSDSALALYDTPLWNLAIVASRLHLVWIATVCGKLKTDFRYSNTLGWNTFPLPVLTQATKAELTRCAEAILLAREAHYPATLAHLYDPSNMPENLARAHEANDEALERAYMGRRFRNDTERLEKLFDMYAVATSPKPEVLKRDECLL